MCNTSVVHSENVIRYVTDGLLMCRMNEHIKDICQ